MNARELLIAETLEWTLACIQCHFDISCEPKVIAARAALEDLRREREEFEAWGEIQDALGDPFADDDSHCGCGCH